MLAEKDPIDVFQTVYGATTSLATWKSLLKRVGLDLKHRAGDVKEFKIFLSSHGDDLIDPKKTPTPQPTPTPKPTPNPTSPKTLVPFSDDEKTLMTEWYLTIVALKAAMEQRRLGVTKLTISRELHSPFIDEGVSAHSDSDGAECFTNDASECGSYDAADFILGW